MRHAGDEPTCPQINLGEGMPAIGGAAKCGGLNTRAVSDTVGDDCRAGRSSYAAGVKSEPDECQPWPAAACFDIKSRMSGIETRRCMATISMCDQLLAMMSKEPDWQFSSKECYVVRTERLP